MHRPRMTKGVYLAIGTALRDTLQAEASIGNDEGGAAVASAALRIADVFVADNPLFDRDRFLHYVETGRDVRVTPASVKRAQKAMRPASERSVPKDWQETLADEVAE